MSKRTIQEDRKVAIKLVNNGEIHNHRLVEFFTRRISEKGTNI